MEKIYCGQTVHKENKAMGFIIIFVFLVTFLLFFILLAHKWATIPIVYKSMSQNTIVRVTKANGDNLPLSPLPKKYEIIHVE